MEIATLFAVCEGTVRGSCGRREEVGERTPLVDREGRPVVIGNEHGEIGRLYLAVCASNWTSAWIVFEWITQAPMAPTIPTASRAHLICVLKLEKADPTCFRRGRGTQRPFHMALTVDRRRIQRRLPLAAGTFDRSRRHEETAQLAQQTAIRRLLSEVRRRP